jgi:O-antigen/teichoic acid export membrane protein
MTMVAVLSRACRGFLALSAGNYGAIAAGLLVNALLARRLGTEEYGRLALMLMASQLLLLLTVNWTHAGFVRFGARDFASRGAVAEVLWARLGVVLPAAAAAFTVVALARQPLADYFGIPAAGVWLILMHFGAAALLSVVSAIFQANDQMTRYGVCLFLDKAVMLLSVAALPASWLASPLVILVCYAASSVSVAVWAVTVAGVSALAPVMPSGSAYRQFVAFSMPLLLSSWAGLFGTNWFDLVILKWYVPLASVGVYSLATQLAGVVQQITVIFSMLVLPQLSVMVAEGQESRIRMFVERLLPYWLLGTSVLFSLVLLAGRIAVPLIFGTAFGEAAAILALLMVAATALALFNACAPLMTAYGSTWLLTTICFASAALNVVLDLILIPRLGVAGSALATVGAYGASALLVLVVLRRRIGGGVLRLMWLSAPAVAACACYLLLDNGWVYPATLTATCVTALALVTRFRLFQTDDVLFLKELRLALPVALSPASPAWRRL